MSMPRLRWQDCDPVFEAIAREGLVPILVGGQAVNLWLDYYARVGGPVALGAPVASKDIDVLGDLPMAQRCAAVLGGRCTPINSQKLAVPMVAILRIGPEEGGVRVDFQMGSDPNDKAELEAAAIPLPTPWGTVSVMHPLHLLKSRTFNVLDAWHEGKRKYDNPHGLRQLQSAMDVFRCYVRELVSRGDTRRVLNNFEDLFRFADGDFGTRLWARKKIDLFRCIEALAGLPDGFYEKRFPQMWKRMILRR